MTSTAHMSSSDGCWRRVSLPTLGSRSPPAFRGRRPTEQTPRRSRGIAMGRSRDDLAMLLSTATRPVVVTRARARLSRRFCRVARLTAVNRDLHYAEHYAEHFLGYSRTSGRDLASNVVRQHLLSHYLAGGVKTSGSALSKFRTIFPLGRAGRFCDRLPRDGALAARAVAGDEHRWLLPFAPLGRARAVETGAGGPSAPFAP